MINYNNDLKALYIFTGETLIPKMYTKQMNRTLMTQIKRISADLFFRINSPKFILGIIQKKENNFKKRYSNENELWPEGKKCYYHLCCTSFSSLDSSSLNRS
jgi:hypothetical protein